MEGINKMSKNGNGNGNGNGAKMKEHLSPRSEVVSERNAAIKVVRINLTPAERKDLSVKRRLSEMDIKMPEKEAA